MVRWERSEPKRTHLAHASQTRSFFMTSIGSISVPEINENINVLKGVFQFDPKDVKTNMMRRAERSLALLESFFNSGMIKVGQEWVRTQKAQEVLAHKINIYNNLEEKIQEHSQQLSHLEELHRGWEKASPQKKQKILEFSKRCEGFQDNQMHIVDAHVLVKWERYQNLKVLEQLFLKKKHLLDSLYYYSNREKYEENLIKAKEKIQSAERRLASVSRGFLFALICCFLVITLPLCLPMTYSLWKRKKEISFQLSDLMEQKRRDQKRLELADEGVIALEEMQKLAGTQVDVTQAENLLREAEEISSEIGFFKEAGNETIVILSQCDSIREELRELIGEPPRSDLDLIAWTVVRTDEIQKLEKKVEFERSRIHYLKVKQSEGVKNRKPEELESSLLDLIESLNQAPLKDVSPFCTQLGLTFCTELSELIKDVRGILSLVSYGYRVDGQVWQACEARLGLKEAELSLSEFNVKDTQTLEAPIGESLSIAFETEVFDQQH